MLPESLTSIKDHAFENLFSLSSIVLPNGVTEIGDSIFRGCTSLSSIVLPDGVTTIGDSAFSGCTSLSSIVLPNGVTTIGDSAFSGCTSLSSIVLPDGVITIGKGAFSGCTSLSSIVLPDGVTAIGDSAFNGCTSLSSIFLPASVDLRKNAFNSCESLTLITMTKGTGEMGNWSKHDDTYFSYSRETWVSILSDVSSLKSVVISTGITEISASAFRNCRSLCSIVIPEGMRDIGFSAFRGCSSLESIVIPNSVVQIGEEAFAECSSLSSISLPASVDLDPSIFISCKSLSSITITKGTGIMKMWDFTEFIPDTDYEDFEDTASVLASIPFLETIIVSEGVKYLSKFAFSYCKSLVSVILPSSLEMIDTAVFEGCTTLKSITMPMEVKVGCNIFKGCKSLSSFTIIKNTNDIIANDNFLKESVTSTKADDSYDDFSYNYYKIGGEPFSFSKKKQGGDSDGYMVDMNIPLIEVVILDGVVSIRREFFFNQTELSTIVIPNSVTEIGADAFEGCISLKTIKTSRETFEKFRDYFPKDAQLQEL